MSEAGPAHHGAGTRALSRSHQDAGPHHARAQSTTERALACDRILDRGYGKPPQLNTTDAGQFRRAVDMTDDELARIASGGAPAEQPPLDPKKVN